MTEQQKINWRVTFIAYAPLLLWIGVIFFMSSPEASFDQTSRIIGPLITYFFPGIPEAAKAVIHSYVRKTAHFTEYAVLAFLAVRAFTGSASYFLQKWRYVIALMLVAVVASLDEFNQSFEASRTGSGWDVALDISGGSVMIFFLWLVNRPRVHDLSVR